ncbi:hypothetical protein [Salinarimonas soli]|uniref:Uncharacterized protein n=1 Tax=Salinarimonas soli TaxID=1638099 RepID=A0A5B2VEL7_9HYPH|nr:hypothetical protein [Salinarimonas soli]KAA2236627.1 hypothetical protein F0L46_14265 [Salinarimonas soli]
MKRRKLWLGLSTAILAAPTPGLPAAIAAEGGLVVAQAHGEHGAKAKAPPAEAKGATASGEGGEGGEGASGAALPPELRLSRGIGLVRGHLLVGNELIEAGRWADALPHFLHPSEEVYGTIRGDLKAFDVPPFDVALKALAQTVKAKNKEAYARARATLDERLAAADRGLKAKEANWDFFTLETALEVLKSAASEYEEALKGDRIVNVVEYQDSRGFVLEAERMIGSVGENLARKDADAAAAVKAALADLKTAWPATLPPKTAVKDVSAVLGDISRIELQLGRLR